MQSRLTAHDLVVMAVLTEGPVHGYRLIQILQERDVQDWAAMSKPQVYYSLKKLDRLGFVKPKRRAPDSAGPERDVLELSAAGKRALEAGLDDDAWATQRPPPPFLTWLALAPHLSAKSRRRVIARRRAYLVGELARERRTLATYAAAHGPMVAPAKLMVSLTVGQFQLELQWLDDVEASL